MTAFLVLAGLLLVLFLAAWYGSHFLFHPPFMLKMDTFPDKFGLPYEKVSFKTEDGLTLAGWLIPSARQTDKTVMICHGWGDNKGDVLERLHFLAKEFNLFLFDFRFHGESEGHMTSLVYYETRDTKAALEFLARAKPAWRRNLGTFGHSMGATLAIWAASTHPDVKAVAVESPFASFNEVVNQFACVNYHLPYFPFGVMTLAIMRWRLGLDPEPFSPIYHVGRISPRPTFFIAGEKDMLMPLEVVRKVYERSGEPKALWTVAGAAHRFCAEVGGAEYQRRLIEFFAKAL
ncbi:MAG: alpha/beta hydrolase [Elusimicrobia bacterium]|nr:alpha/beta hydrolase [Elusimicrobiota bacterium]